MEKKNMVKYETYKLLYSDLNKALKLGFYYQAIFIEYAIIEDRLKSILKYAEVPCVDKNGKDISINRKITKIENRSEFNNKYIKSKFSNDFISTLRSWIDHRNKLVHQLPNIQYADNDVERIALEGKEIVNQVNNKSRGVINFVKKQK